MVWRVFAVAVGICAQARGPRCTARHGRLRMHTDDNAARVRRGANSAAGHGRHACAGVLMSRRLACAGVPIARRGQDACACMPTRCAGVPLAPRGAVGTLARRGRHTCAGVPKSGRLKCGGPGCALECIRRRRARPRCTGVARAAAPDCPGGPRVPRRRQPELGRRLAQVGGRACSAGLTR